MAEESETKQDDKAKRPARASGGRGLAAFALLVAFAALGGAAYLYAALVLVDAGDGERITALETANDRLEGEVRRLAQEQRVALDALRAERETAFTNFRGEQEQRRRSAEEALAQALQRATTQNTDAPARAPDADWRLAEAEYLLRLANHQVRMERDIRTALDLLRSADSLLKDLDDFTLYEVRATLAAELRHLEQAPVINRSDIYLRLDAAKRQLSALSLALPKFQLHASAAAPDTSAVESHRDNPTTTGVADPDPTLPADPAAAFATDPAAALPIEATSAESGGEPSTSPIVAVASGVASTTSTQEGHGNRNAGLWNSLADEFGRLLRFRRIDTDFKPPPAPAEAAYLELNLRLMLEQAQIAALRANQPVYAASLDRALEWANAYLDRQNPQAQEALSALEALRQLNLDPPAPDISSSLSQLQALRRG